MCPNCHSQTETYGGKSNKNKSNKQKIKICNSVNINKDEKIIYQRKRKAERPPYEQLLNEIKELGYCGTGRKYGVSDNAIRKWIKHYEKYKLI